MCLEFMYEAFEKAGLHDHGSTQGGQLELDIQLTCTIGMTLRMILYVHASTQSYKRAYVHPPPTQPNHTNSTHRFLCSSHALVGGR